MRWGLGALLCVGLVAWPALATETVSYGYDDLGRLASSSTSGSVNNGLGTSVSYDAAGNRTNYLVTGSSGSGSESSSFDSAATTYFAAMTTQPDLARKALISVLISGLKADGVWSKIGWLSLLASHDAQAARLNAKDPTQAFSVVGSPSFTADRGYRDAAGSGSNYLDSGVTLGSSGLASQNSLFVASWLRSDGSASWRGAVGTHTTPLAYIISSDSVLYGSAGDGGNLTYSTSPQGFAVISRTDSATKKLYKNGVLVASDTSGTISLTTGNMRALSTAFGTDGTHMVAAWGAGLSATDVSNLYNRLNTYLTAIGAN